MRIEHLSLSNFRNYARLEWSPPPGTTLIHGANAQGKTSLLEAICYLALSRSPWSSSDRQLIHWRSQDEPIPFARLAADVSSRHSPLERLEVTLMLEDSGQATPRFRKVLRLNGADKRVMDLVGHLNVVLFLPRDLALVEGSPADRRQFIDNTLSQVDAACLEALNRFGKLLPQRNALLRRIQERRAAPHELDFWDAQLVEAAAVIIAARQRFLRELEASACRAHHDLTGGRETLSLRYQPSFAPTAGGDGQLSFILRALICTANWTQRTSRPNTPPAWKRNVRSRSAGASRQRPAPRRIAHRHQWPRRRPLRQSRSGAHGGDGAQAGGAGLDAGAHRRAAPAAAGRGRGRAGFQPAQLAAGTPRRRGPDAVDHHRTGDLHAGIPAARFGAADRGRTDRQPGYGTRPVRWLRAIRVSYYGWRIALTLAITETISWGILYYTFAVFIRPMELDTGWSRTELTGAFSLALLLRGAMAVPVGIWIDRHGARLLMTVASLLASALLVLWSQADDLVMFYLVWSGLGLCMAALFYEPAFTVIANWFLRKRARALALITLVAGFASTIFLPLANSLLQEMAGAGPSCCSPFCWPRRPSPCTRWCCAGDRPTSGCRRTAPVRILADHRNRQAMSAGDILRGSVFWSLTAAFSLAMLSATAIRVHFVPLPARRGGGRQSGGGRRRADRRRPGLGRLVFAPVAGRVSLLLLTSLSLALQLLALLLLLLPGGDWRLWLFVLLFGAAVGSATLLRPALLAERFGPARFGRISSVMVVFLTLAGTVAPVGASAIHAPGRRLRPGPVGHRRNHAGGDAGPAAGARPCYQGRR